MTPERMAEISALAADGELDPVVFELLAEVDRLRAAIAAHRDATGHAMCWENDRELWEVLDEPVGDRVPPPLPEFMGRCAAYWLTRQRS